MTASPPPPNPANSDAPDRETMLQSIGKRLTESAVLIVVLGGVCYFLGAVVRSKGLKSSGLPSDLFPESSPNDLMAIGAIVLFLSLIFIATGAFALAALYAALRPLKRLVKHWTAKPSKFVAVYAREARRSERYVWLTLVGFFRACPKTALALLLLGFGWALLQTSQYVTNDLSRTPGKPVTSAPLAEVQLRDRTLSNLRYVRRTDGFFLLYAETDSEYVMIPDSEILRLDLAPVAEPAD